MDLVALDVEYVHLQCPSTKQVLRVPGQVAVVGWTLEPLLNIFLDPFNEISPSFEGFRHVGGVRPLQFRGQPGIKEGRELVRHALLERFVIGHGLTGDLEYLEMQLPTERTFDTIRAEAFQGSAGQAHSLKQLARRHLLRDIQEPGMRHDALEDATAVMELYLKHIHNNPKGMSIADKEALYLENIMRGLGTVEGRD